MLGNKYILNWVHSCYSGAENLAGPDHIKDDEGVQWLNSNIRFRSNDAWGANFMNMFGFIQFNREVIADEIAKRNGKVVKFGRLNWHADSFHIYGKDIEKARTMLFDRLETLSFEERIFNFHDDFIREMYDEAEAMVKMKIAEHDRTR